MENGHYGAFIPLDRLPWRFWYQIDDEDDQIEFADEGFDETTFFSDKYRAKTIGDVNSIENQKRRQFYQAILAVHFVERDDYWMRMLKNFTLLNRKRDEMIRVSRSSKLPQIYFRSLMILTNLVSETAVEKSSWQSMRKCARVSFRVLKVVIKKACKTYDRDISRIKRADKLEITKRSRPVLAVSESTRKGDIKFKYCIVPIACNAKERDGHCPRGLLPPVVEMNARPQYKLLIDHVEEMLPVIYMPAVGEACHEYGSIFWQLQGMVVSFQLMTKMLSKLKNRSERNIGVIVEVVTDGERILGDLGCKGMNASVGKLSFYAARGSSHPFVEYDELLAKFLTAVKKCEGAAILFSGSPFAPV